MADFALTPSPALTRAPVERGGTRLDLRPPEAVHALALRPEAPGLAAAVARAAGPLPEVGRSSVRGERLILRPALERAYVLGPAPGGGAGFEVLDQSGFWVVLALTGPGARAVLERSWAPDLGESAFPPGAVSQSTLGPVPAMLHRAGAESYRILAPRSYAGSLFEEVETSLEWVC